MSRVLIVDDEINILKTLSIGLKRYQYDVMEALNGHEALNIMQNSPCDFVVSDIRMAPMDGYTLASKLRIKYPKVNVILISAYDFEDEKFKFLRKIILVHHHFYKRGIEATASQSSLWNKIESFTLNLRGKKKLMSLFSELGINLILHGHSHEVKEYERKGLRFLNAGAVIDNSHPEEAKLLLIRTTT